MSDKHQKLGIEKGLSDEYQHRAMVDARPRPATQNAVEKKEQRLEKGRAEVHERAGEAVRPAARPFPVM